MLVRVLHMGCDCALYVYRASTLKAGEISEKGPDMVRKKRTMSGLLFFRSTFFGLFLCNGRTKGGLCVPQNRRDCVSRIERGAISRCEYSHQGPGRRQAPTPIRKVGKRVVTRLKVAMSTGALEPKDITHCFVLKGFPLAWSMLEGANS